MSHEYFIVFLKFLEFLDKYWKVNKIKVFHIHVHAVYNIEYALLSSLKRIQKLDLT